MIWPNYNEYQATQTASRMGMRPHGWPLAGADESREKTIQAVTIFLGSREAAIAFLDGLEERAQSKVKDAVKPMIYVAGGLGAAGLLFGLIALIRGRSK